MKRGKPKADRRRKATKSGQPRQQAQRERPRSRTIESPTQAEKTKQQRALQTTPAVPSGSDAPITAQRKARPTDRRALTEASASAFDAVAVAELMEACRAHVASLVTLAGTTSHALFEYYDYKEDEPKLWQCCHLVRQVLRQAQAALMPLGIVSHETAPRVRAAEVAMGCEAQRQWLRPAVHVIRATIHVLLDIKPGHEDELLPSLRDLEGGLLLVIDGLERVIQRCPTRIGWGPAL